MLKSLLSTERHGQLLVLNLSKRGESYTPASIQGLASDQRGAAAVEFAIVAMPFILLLLGILQLGIYFLTQSALDSGVVQTADALTNTYFASSVPPILTSATLKGMVVTKANGMIGNNANLSVELRLLTSLDAAVVPVGNTIDLAIPGSILALRAQATVVSVIPFLTLLNVRSSALVRRQGL